jgi:hypothetical protein
MVASFTWWRVGELSVKRIFVTVKLTPDILQIQYFYFYSNASQNASTEL